MPKVSLKKCNNYEKVKEAISDSLKPFGGINKFIKKGDKILLKPNICDPLPPEKAVSTHPLFVKAVVELVKEAGGIPIIGESSAGDSKGVTKKAFRVSGISDIAKKTGVAIHNFQEEPFILKEIKNHKKLKKGDFAKTLFDVDVIINLPKLKTHGITFLTGAIKNTFGCVNHKNRALIHKIDNKEEFSNAIIDIYDFIKPQLTIMDAVIAMEGDEGPSFGNPKKAGYVIAGTDGVAVDAVAARITGHDPLKIPLIRLAHERKIGIGNLNKIKIIGDKIDIIKDFKKNSKYNNKYENLVQPYISIRCKKCGSCFENCPVGAIIGNKKQGFVIDEEKCIRCLCCHEVCIHGAIDLKKFKNHKNPQRASYSTLKSVEFDRTLSLKGGFLGCQRRCHISQPKGSSFGTVSVHEKLASLSLGSSCNQNCVFCTVADYEKHDLPTKDVKGRIDELAKSGVTKIDFTGGEPTLRTDLEEIFSYAKNKGLIITLQTNGALLSDESYVKRLKEAGLTGVLISLHSHRKDVSDKLSQSRDFEKTILGLKNLIKNGIHVSISHVINSRNYKELVDFVEFVSSFSDKINLYFGFVRPKGNALRNTRIVPKLCEIELYLHDALELCNKKGIRFSFEGIPLCYVHGFEEHCSETQRMKRTPQIYVENKSMHKDLHGFIRSNLKKKAECCSLCSFNGVCVGVWREYAGLYGTEELYPVFKMGGVKNG